MTVSETFPSWFIGRNPSRRVIAVSYGDSLARRYGRANLQKIEEYGASVFGIDSGLRNSAMINWGIEGDAGGMISAGIGGPITGEGADLLIIDDPIKNRQSANSPTYRELVWSEWQNTLLTRLHSNGAVVLVLTRWHEDDIAGRLLADDPDGWHVVKLPAIAEEDDMLGREVGEPLWADHGFGHEWAAATKTAVGSYTWNALYQQRPSPAEGGMIQRGWWRFYDEPPPVEAMMQSWDMTFKETKDGSFVVGQVWGRRGSERFLLDQVRERLDFVDTIKLVEHMAQKWPRASAKLVEDRANGPAVLSVLSKKVSGLIPIEPKGSKEARAAAVSPFIEAGNIWLPHPSRAAWVQDFIEECAAFPTAARDDQVDAMSQALMWWAESSWDEKSVNLMKGVSLYV